MTESTKIDPLNDARASIASIGDVIRAPVGAVAMNGHGHSVYASARKILSL